MHEKFPKLDDFMSVASKSMKRSVIRELLKLTNKPDVISFAGGLPAPETFPVDDLKQIACDSIDKYGSRMLQYGATEGDERLRSLLLNRFQAKTSVTGLTLENILIVSASQQALDMIGKIFINPGDVVLVERPSYLGGLSVFRAYGAEMVGVELESDGIDIVALEAAIDDIHAQGKRVKFFYAIPDFQNPAGTCYSLAKRKQLIAIAQKHDFFIIEDAPYRELRYVGNDQPYLYELDQSGRVISLFTFSKIYCPGFRLGWVIAHRDVIDKLVVTKQAVDLCTSAFSQILTAEYMSRGLLDERVRKNIELYSRRRQTMLDAFDTFMPKDVGIKWTVPDGGLFLWVTLPGQMNADDLFFSAIENNVAYVVGSAFYANNVLHNSFRMNFSYPHDHMIVEGTRRLAQVLTRGLAKLAGSPAQGA